MANIFNIRDKRPIRRDTIMPATTSVELIKKISCVMDILLETEEDLGVREISRLCDIPKSSTSRLLSSLEGEGWVYQNENTKKYRIGLRMLAYANRWRLNLELVKQSDSYLQKLLQITKQTVILAVYDRHLGGVCIHKLESNKPIKLVSKIGNPIPLHTGGSGKSLLAYLPESIQNGILQGPLTRYTPNTITDPEVLREELRRIREKGYAIGIEEVDAGVAGIGVPILDEKGGLIAGLSIAGPKFDFEGHFEELIPSVVETASELSKKISRS